MEEFKEIKGVDWLEGCFISNYGRVKKPNGQFFPRRYGNNTAFISEFEGENVWLGERGRTINIAKLMCKAFYSDYNEETNNINYINGIAHDVRLDNITYKEKMDVTLNIRTKKEVGQVNNTYVDKDGNTVIVYNNMNTYMKEFIEWLKDKDVSDNTIRSYYTRVQEYWNYNNVLTKNKILEFKKVLLAKGKSPKTINLFLVGIRQYLIFLSKHLDNMELYKISTELKPIKIQNTTHLENVITKKELDKLLEYCKKKNKKYYYIALTLANTGARISEFVTFKIKGVFDGYFEVYGKGGKYRKILLPKPLQQELKEYVKELYGSSYDLDDYLFKNRDYEQISTRGVAHRLKDLAKEAGIKNVKSVHPHSFRHYFAKTLLDKTKDISFVSSMLGHSSVATTSIYTKKSLSEQQKLLDKLGN